MKKRRPTKKKDPARLEMEQQFLAMVQAGLLIKAIEAVHGDRTMPIKRPLDTIQWLADAYRVAPSIPGDVPAVEAAEAFLTWVIDRDRLDDRDRFILGVLFEE